MDEEGWSVFRFLYKSLKKKKSRLRKGRSIFGIINGGNGIVNVEW